MKAVAQTEASVLFFNTSPKKQPLTQELLQMSRESAYIKEEPKKTLKSQPLLEHTHWFSEVFFIVSGEGKFFINNSEYPVSQGDLVFINANISHTELNENHLVYYCLGISNIHFEVDSTSYVFPTRERGKDFLNVLDKMWDEFCGEEKSAQDFINNYFDHFCLLLQRHCKFNLLPAHVLSSSNRSAAKSSGPVEVVRGYMENNLPYDINLDQLAKLAFISKQHLTRLFNENIGYTPMQYLNRLRISKSMYNLMLRNDSVAEIAYQFGFKSSYAYIKMFKKTTGYTPQQFRLAYENNIQEAERILSEVSNVTKKEKNK